MHAAVTVETLVVDSPRVAQVRGLFDLPPEKTQRLSWDATLPLEDRPWNVGLIVGPSGCGKSTLVRRLWPHAADRSDHWDPGRSLLDAFPSTLGVKEIVELLSSVGFSSPPAWLRPFQVLSTGQQFRVTLARLLAEALAAPAGRGPVVFDEYSSVVDRTAAQIGSAALARTVRSRGLQFIASTCHDDVEDWLQPDWVYRPAEAAFAWRRLRRRPAVELQIVRCRPSAWPLFAPNHYLSGRLAPSAVCFLATWRGRPVAFSAWLPFLGAGPRARREHRTVTLPDFQGVGLGGALSACIAAMWRGLGLRALSTTTHPGLIQARCRSPLWRMTRRPGLARGRERGFKKLRHATTRLTAGFEYVGPPLDETEARALHGR
jgi:GNAT superfamily N-acetyltransferase